MSTDLVPVTQIHKPIIIVGEEAVKEFLLEESDVVGIAFYNLFSDYSATIKRDNSTEFSCLLTDIPSPDGNGNDGKYSVHAMIDGEVDASWLVDVPGKRIIKIMR